MVMCIQSLSRCMPVDYSTDELAEDSVVKADVIAECLAQRAISCKEYYDKHTSAVPNSGDVVGVLEVHCFFCLILSGYLCDFGLISWLG